MAYPWGGSGTVAEFALILAEHDEEHTVEIEADEARGLARDFARILAAFHALEPSGQG